ncbi:uncharacterized protein LOC103978984 isoform X2 [Musa acuminata AAA Group]|uniref:uncharacterized protein LOC103978984 isoform X2 n=1 Tax=Musa acuminata AAA Group TaxID=214697 RepID=UPI0031E01243
MSMTFCYHGPLPLKLRLLTVRAVNSPEPAVDSIDSGSLRLQLLERVDEELKKGNERGALSLINETHGKPGGLRCFGTARQVPQRLYSLDELKLNGIDTSSFLSPIDVTLGSIERNLQLAAVLGGVSAWFALGFSPAQILYFSLGLLFLWSLDLIYFNGGVRNLVLDTIGHKVSQKYHHRVIQGYTLSSLEALIKERSLNVQAGTAFVDFEFIEEINTGKVSAKMLNRFSCIALAGVATEYLLFGYSEGGLADIDKLDTLLKSMGFTQKKADSQVRWAVLNTILLLRRHEKARSQLAETMSSGKSVGSCIDAIENSIEAADV